MKAKSFVVVVIVLAAAVAFAGTRKILVLPVDGNADADAKTKLTASLQRLATKLDGTVTTGDTSFAEAASAVGCDPAEPTCADTVLTTLAVDEIVWGTATTDNGQTTVVIKRAAKGAPVQVHTTVLAATDSPDSVETDAAPMFGNAAAPTGSGSGSAVAVSHGSFFDTRERKLGVGLAIGGGLAIAIGISFWSSESDLQTQINNHSTATVADIAALKDLESQAKSKALWGNIMVFAGLAAGGAGAYFLWKDHEHRTITNVTPVPAENGTGATLVLGGRW